MRARSDIDCFMPAVEALELLRKRTVSAVELLDRLLDRIGEHNESLNAIVTLDEDRARETAREADQARARGDERDLLGLPITVKDCIDVAGLRGTAGAQEFADRCPTSDAPAVMKLLAAGAVLVGKTNVPPWASDFQASNPIFGRTNNPWDLGRTPGGSTGGGAAALAGGLTFMELGSDIAGSIRVPAAFCGVYGLKPSETAVAHSGHFPGSPLPNAATALEVMGPLARSADDLELALNVIAGPDVGEDAGWKLEFPAARRERLADFRAAMLPPLPWLPLDDAIASAQEDLAKDMASMGVNVAWTSPEFPGDFRGYHRLYSSLLGVMTAWGQSDSERERHAAEAREGDEFDAAYGYGFGASACEYLRWHQERERYREAWRQFFGEWDVLIAPASIVPAFLHQDPGEDARSIKVNGKPVNYNLQTVYPGIASLPGQPAVAFPVGVSRGGLPIGLQAIGPYLEDRTPLRFASLLARERGGFRAPPGWE